MDAEREKKIELLKRLVELRKEALEAGYAEKTPYDIPDEIIFKKKIDNRMFFVVDAFIGYNIFQDENMEIGNINSIVHKSWNKDKNEAIEECIRIAK